MGIRPAVMPTLSAHNPLNYLTNPGPVRGPLRKPGRFTVLRSAARTGRAVLGRQRTPGELASAGRVRRRPTVQVAFCWERFRRRLVGAVAARQGAVAARQGAVTALHRAGIRQRRQPFHDREGRRILCGHHPVELLVGNRHPARPSDQEGGPGGAASSPLARVANEEVSPGALFWAAVRPGSGPGWRWVASRSSRPSSLAAVMGVTDTITAAVPVAAMLRGTWVVVPARYIPKAG